MNGNLVTSLEKVLFAVIWIAVCGFIVLLTAAGWPSYWKFIAAETTSRMPAAITPSTPKACLAI